jgi:hypothetical protein
LGKILFEHLDLTQQRPDLFGVVAVGRDLFLQALALAGEIIELAARARAP